MRTAGFSLLIAALAGMGCTSLPRLWPEHKVPPAAPSAARLQPVVSPDQVNDDNARAMAAALLDELDQDAQRGIPSTGQQPPADGKHK